MVPASCQDINLRVIILAKWYPVIPCFDKSWEKAVSVIGSLYVHGIHFISLSLINDIDTGGKPRNYHEIVLT